jgi:hypothetical protein
VRIALGAPKVEAPIPNTSVEIIQTSCSGSYATAGSLMKDQGPPWWIVVPGSIPVVQVRPAFVVVAQPILLAPPPKTRPVWKATTTVLP